MRSRRTRRSFLAALCVVLHALVLSACSDAGVTPDCSKVQCGPSSAPQPDEESGDDDAESADESSDESADDDADADAGENAEKSGE